MKESRQLMFDSAMKVFPRKSVQRAHFKRKVRIVYQNIDRAELLLRSSDHFVNLNFLRDIGLKDHAAAAGVLNFVENICGSFFVSVVINDDGGAALGQTDGRRGADAAARAGHENNFTL